MPQPFTPSAQSLEKSSFSSWGELQISLPAVGYSWLVPHLPIPSTHILQTHLSAINGPPWLASNSHFLVLSHDKEAASQYTVQTSAQTPARWYPGNIVSERAPWELSKGYAIHKDNLLPGSQTLLRPKANSFCTLLYLSTFVPKIEESSWYIFKYEQIGYKSKRHIPRIPERKNWEISLKGGSSLNWWP